MNTYNLNVSSNRIGGYFSSEQIDLLSIIRCQTHDEIKNFICECKQLNGLLSKEDIKKLTSQDLERIKRNIFKCYQDTLVPHNSDRQTVLDNTLNHLGLLKEDIDVIKKAYTDKNINGKRYIRDYIKNKYPDNYKEIFK